MNMWDEFIESIPVRDDAVDGRCPVCHQPVTTKVNILGKYRVVPVACNCQIQARKDREQMVARERHHQMRQECFFGAYDLAANRFCDSPETKEEKIAVKYAGSFSRMLTEGQGLLFLGSPGTGKTYQASCIANYIIDRDYSVHFLNAAMLPSMLFSARDKNALIESINTCHLLVIDDLGAERGNQYAAECVYNIVNARYNTAMPMIVTTNLTPASMVNTEDMTLKRIYERINQRCYPVAFTGKNRRAIDALQRKTELDNFFEV